MGDPKCELMIGISTAQNTTNLVPFIQFSGQSLILLETRHAQEKNWDKGIKEVVEGRGKKFRSIFIGEGSDINESLRIIESLTKDISTPICWNIGGGQKSQTMALFMALYDRINSGYNDWACYSEPQTRKTSIITNEDGKNIIELLPTDTTITVQEIVKTFNYMLVGNKLKCLWKRNSHNNDGTIYIENILTKEQENFFSDYNRRQAMFLHTYKVAIGDKFDDCNDVFPDDSINFATFFEKIVQTKVTHLIAENPNSHTINEVWANVEVSAKFQKDTKQEFDVVLVTNFGTIIPLDAKTFEFTKKDEDSRYFNLNKVSGVYTEFWSVFPFMQRDLEADSILQTCKDWRKLLNRPFELTTRGSKMLVCSEPEKEDFSIIRKKNKVQVGTGKKDLTLLPLHTLIDALKLSQ